MLKRDKSLEDAMYKRELAKLKREEEFKSN
jgi:hypothetical protein